MSNNAERLAIRLPPEILEDVKAYRAHLVAHTFKGVREPSLSDAARILILRGLEAVKAGNIDGEGVPRG
jgi:hypothetical protein